jgi:hypothetical protein
MHGDEGPSSRPRPARRSSPPPNARHRTPRGPPCRRPQPVTCWPRSWDLTPGGESHRARAGAEYSTRTAGCHGRCPGASAQRPSVPGGTTAAGRGATRAPRPTEASACSWALMADGDAGAYRRRSTCLGRLDRRSRLDGIRRHRDSHSRHSGPGTTDRPQEPGHGYRPRRPLDRRHSLESDDPRLIGRLACPRRNPRSNDTGGIGVRPGSGR